MGPRLSGIRSGFRVFVGTFVKILLGVVDVAYSDAGGKGGTKTTGDVAQILEHQYHVMEVFYEERRDHVAEWMADAIRDQIADLITQAPISSNPFLDAEQRIEASFRRFLSDDEMQKIMPITQQITAAQMGMSKRFKAGHSKGYKPRPAFIDTGLYQASFRAWVQR